MERRPHPYDLTTYDGKKVDWLTRAALEAVDRKIKEYNLSISQGSYNNGAVEQSAGTHDGGGVVDLPPYDYMRKVRLLRTVGGFWAWYRPELWKNGKKVWSSHVHAVLEGNVKLSPSAKDQVIDGKNGLNGLADNGPDPHADIPVVPFKWPYAGPVGRLRWIMRNSTPKRRRQLRKELEVLIEEH